MNRRHFLALTPGIAAWCLAPTAAMAAQEPRLQVTTDAVHVGEAFFVRIFSPVPVWEVRLSWMGETLTPALRGESGGYGTWVALAAGLDVKPGSEVLEAEFQLQNGTKQVSRGVIVHDRSYPEQHLKVARKMVHLSKEALERHYREKALTKKVLDSRSAERFWQPPFVRPVKGSMSSAFGLRRFFNGEPRRPHSGVDLRGRTGTPIHSFAAGEVALTGNHYFSGNVVYVDHGQGMVTVYCHMSHIDVEEGQFVSAGQVLGKVGATGRVTGPHLHFGLSVMGHMVDPMPLFAGTGVPDM
ncbi:M23 family metallopeptidase [Desulfobaculum sp.]